MSQYVIPFQVQPRRDQAEAAGVASPQAPALALASVTIPAAAPPIEVRFPSLPRNAVIVGAKITDPAVPQVLTASIDAPTLWVAIIDGAPIPADILSNGLTPIFSTAYGNAIRIDGAAAAGFTLPAAVTVAVSYYTPSGRIVETLEGGVVSEQVWNHQLGLGFADDGAGDDPVAGDFSGLWSRLEAIFARAGGGSYRASPNLVIPQVGYAAPSPSGAVILTSADLGTGPNQVPTDRALWQASQFAPHPSTFFRWPANVRGIFAATPVTDQNLNPLQGPDLNPPDEPPLRLYQVNRRPTHSQWLLVADGDLFVVCVEHVRADGQILDVRRPRDIWTQVLVPLMVSQQAAGGVPPRIFEIVQTGLVGPGAYLFIRRAGIFRGFSFLEYASLIQVLDDDSTPILTPVVVPDPPPPPPG